MPHALVHLADGTYTEFIARDEYQCDINQYASTDNLHANTGYSPELIQLLNNNYASWGLIFSESFTLLVGYDVNGCTLVYGETVTINDWVRDAINQTPSSLEQSDDYEWLLNIEDTGPVLLYLYEVNFMPPLFGYKELHRNQTNNGASYWGCFMPPEYLE